MSQQPKSLSLADALKRRAPILDGLPTIDQAEKELRRLHAENEALKSQALSMRDALETAETVFRSYHKHHKQKGDDVKAQANLDLAEQMAAA